MREPKSERFRRVAEARVNKIIKMIRLLGNCSNMAVYSFSSNQIEQIFEVLQAELYRAKKRYEHPEKKKFTLSDNVQTEAVVAPTIEQLLPDGTRLRAVAYAGESFPAINIYWIRTDVDDEELICFVEYNPERSPLHEVCVGTYQSHQDDTTYYKPYMAERESNE